MSTFTQQGEILGVYDSNSYAILAFIRFPDGGDCNNNSPCRRNARRGHYHRQCRTRTRAHGD